MLNLLKYKWVYLNNYDIIKYRTSITHIDSPDPSGQQGRERSTYRLKLSDGKIRYVESLPAGTRPGYLYDHNTGGILSPESSIGRKPSITEELEKRDAEYLQAVNDGDMKKASMMVEAAAKRSGYSNKGYHGTERGGFNEFQVPAFITSNKKEADAYSSINEDVMVGVKIQETIKLGDFKGKVPSDIGDTFWPVFSDFNGDPDVLQTGQALDGVFDLPQDHPYNDSEEDHFSPLFYWNGSTNPVGDRTVVVIQDYVYDFKNNKIVSFDDVKSNFEARTGDKFPETVKIPGERKLPKQYKPEIMSVYVKIKKPLRLAWDKANRLGKRLGATNELVDRVKRTLSEGGYDSILTESDDARIHQGKHVPQWIIFDPKSIKSADPVVKDDKGNVVPLSKRFNAQSGDIRY